MLDPQPPSERCGLREWNVCIDHPLVYVGVRGPHWGRSHLWVCADASHLPLWPEQCYQPPAFHTTDGSGHFDSAPIDQERELLGFWLEAKGLKPQAGAR
jgi:hypothetical protein